MIDAITEKIFYVVLTEKLELDLSTLHWGFSL